MSILFTILITFFAGLGAGLGTGFAGKVQKCNSSVLLRGICNHRDCRDSSKERVHHPFTFEARAGQIRKNDERR